jgi:hypothetical protein
LKIVSGDSEHDDVDALVAGSRLIIGSIYLKDEIWVYQKLVFLRRT